jgi:hypothetical protein
MLDELMRWRNAIAHNDFDPATFGPNPVCCTSLKSGLGGAP